MKQCKPCMTLRTAVKLFWKNYVVEATYNFKQDYKSYSRVNATECVLDREGGGPVPLIDSYIAKSVKDIRKLATANFNAKPEGYQRQVFDEQVEALGVVNKGLGWDYVRDQKDALYEQYKEKTAGN